MKFLGFALLAVGYLILLAEFPLFTIVATCVVGGAFAILKR